MGHAVRRQPVTPKIIFSPDTPSHAAGYDRALEIRIAKIEEKLAAKADEYEGLYERGGDILEEMLDLQQRLRTFREFSSTAGPTHDVATARAIRERHKTHFDTPS